ncbi:Rossmann-like domain-containing protein [Natronorubrum sp. DTA7]|uniref:Rossmann-like domain-containing protein n=1 Tax=Natronorubrum sp. DTA7 TaxID=3447016 RepID=UPI003F84DA7B
MIDPIRPAIVDRLRSRGIVDGVTVERVTIGDAAVLVELAGVRTAPRSDSESAESDEGTRTAGLAHRPPGESISTDGVEIETLLRWATLETADPATVSDRDGDGTGAGESAQSDATADGDTALRTALGVAAINALSAPCIEWQTGDPMALLDPSVDVIATVGVFRPAFRKFSDVDVRVIERGDVGPVSAPDDVRVTTFRPVDATTAMADADVVFITGSVFVYGGLERYLEVSPADATVVLIGATASGLPEPMFEAGVDVVAGAEVAAPDRVREAVKSGACGTDLHDAGVRKVYTMADGVADPDRGLRGPATTDERVNRSEGANDTIDGGERRSDTIDGGERRSDTIDGSDSNQ